MSFTDAVRTCISKYFTFSGRARRKEYWYFVLFLLLGSAVASVIDRILFGVTTVEIGMDASNEGPVSSLFGLATLVPSLSAGWRRMHDTGRSGLYLLYPLIVMIGIATFAGLLGGFGPLFAGDLGALLAGGSTIILGIALFVLFLSPILVLWWLTRPSQPEPNEYGPVPAGVR